MKVFNRVQVPCFIVAQTFKFEGPAPQVFHVPVTVQEVTTEEGVATQVQLKIGDRIEYLPASNCQFEDFAQECPEGLREWFE